MKDLNSEIVEKRRHLKEMWRFVPIYDVGILQNIFEINESILVAMEVYFDRIAVEMFFDQLKNLGYLHEESK